MAKRMRYFSTRGGGSYDPAAAIVKGLADDGGLFTVREMPVLPCTVEELISLDFMTMAKEILKIFLTDFSEHELGECISRAYSNAFDSAEITPLVSFSSYHFLELFHGRTLAFKDIALSLFPHLLKKAAEKTGINDKITILTATSGDTGKSAASAFSGVPGTEIIVFYPLDGISEIQRLQMITQEGSNVKVVGVRGNFDEIQKGVKKIFSNPDTRKNKLMSSANSINIGRLLPQITYYFHAYAQLVRNGHITFGDKINFTVPTGNFGNILAGYYAKQLGLPVNKLICASNSNKILYDFFTTSVYDTNREFIVTASPSMDILVSGNLERLIYHLTRDTAKCRMLMEKLSADGAFECIVNANDFGAAYAGEDETFSAIAEIYQRFNYLIDTHTAVAAAGYQKYKKLTCDETVNVIVSTASPYKFVKDVLPVLDESYRGRPLFEQIGRLSELTGKPVPAGIAELEKKEILHTAVCEIAEMPDALL